jgi:ribose 5-phosphate isomerase A
MNPKQRAGEAALSYIRSGMAVGLGTGTTADFFIVALATALRGGKLTNIRGVPTSVQSETRARELGIPLATLAECSALDVTVDGADEVDPELNLIKGLGGALLREKVVAQNTKQFVIIADESKVVSILGSKSPLPVEVTSFAHETTARFLSGLGAVPALRRTSSGSPFTTDNGNLIYDCRFRAIMEPWKLDEALAHRAGVVESGLFLNMASVALIAGADSVQTKTRPV